MPLDTPYVDELIFSFLPTKYSKLNKDNLNITLRDCEGISIENMIFDGHDVLALFAFNIKMELKQKLFVASKT